MNRTHYYIYISVLLLLLGAALPLHAQTIKGTIYGGGQLATVDGNTDIKLNTGTVEQDVFGGGKGKLNGNHTVNMSADVTGTTTVTANGTTFKFPEDGIDPYVNHNIYGGGNLACRVNASNVYIYAGLMAEKFMEDESESTSWGKWIKAVKEQDDNIVQGSVFGGGYGVNTIVTTTATVNVNVPGGDDKPTNTAMVDVVGGGYNGYVLNNTSVTVEGMPEIYKIYGGGLGSRGGYDDSPTTERSSDNIKDSNGNKYTMQQTIGSVGEGKEGDGTNVLIKGGKFYNDIFGGGAGLKYKDGERYLNVAEVFGTTSVEVDAPSWIDGDKFSKNIYGGGALGLVADAISVTLKSGEFDGAQVFGGSLGEDRHADDKAKVTGNTHVLVTHNDATPTPNLLKGRLDIYGGCDMAQVDGNTSVTVEYGTFNGSIFGGGLGRSTEYLGDNAEANKDYGKVTGNTSVIIDGGANWESLTLGAPAKYTATEATEANTTNGITEGQPGYVREGDYKKPIKVYGGSALGLIGGTLDVKLKSGTLYGEMFGGSLGELGYVEKAKVTTVATISTEVGSVDSGTGKPYPLNGLFNIYGGCDMAQIENNTHVNLQHGTFSGNIFGGGKGVNELSTTAAGSERYIHYGKVIGNTSIELDAPEIVLGVNNDNPVEKIGIYGGGALGIVDGTINPVTLKSGTLYGSIFGGSLGEKGHLAKAKVTGNTSVVTEPNDTKDSDGVTSKPDALTGIFNIYGGCDLAWVEGNTTVTIGHGDFSGKIFGGGKGLAYAEADGVTGYGMIKGVTEVNYQSDGSFEGDIYGGGALGLITPEGTPEYTTQVNLSNGEINGQIFGGGFGEITGYKSDDDTTWAVLNTAKVTGNTKVETTGTKDLTGNINHVYGGGDMAMVDGNTKLVITHGTFSGTIFGGGHGVISNEETGEEYMDFGKVTGNTDVLIDGPNLALGEADVYDESSAAAENEKNHATLGQAKYVQAGDLIHPMNIYGGGALGIVEGTINVSVCSGTINGAVFAGSLGEEGHVNKAKVTTNATIKTEVSKTNKKADGVTPAVLKGKIDIYGACDMAQFEGNAQVTINHGDFSGRIFGGGKGLPTILAGGVDTNEDYGKVIGKSNVLYDSDGTFTGSIYGGGALGLVVHPNDYVAPTDGTDYITKVRLKKGTINDGYVFGGSLGEKTNPEKAMIHGNTLVVTEEVTNPVTEKLLGNINHVYGGGDMAQVTGNTEVKITHGNFTGDIYGGGNGRAADDASNDNADLGKVIGNSLVTIDGTDIKLGKVDGEKINVYGGGALGIVTIDATVNMENGIVYGKIYGGSFGEEGYAEKAIIQKNTYVNINGGTITGDVFGGGALAKVDKNTYVNINGGSVSHEVYGGGALADVNQNTYVYLYGGTVYDVYGGGLGQLADVDADKETVEAFVKGNTLVQLGKAEGRVTGTRTDASEVKGSIYGANNVNGTPLGKAEVHVWTTKEQTTPVSSDKGYHVKAIYGGGNQSAYQPTNGETAATVIVEVCDNSIQDVYGGGNAAPVSATNVEIYGGTIDRVFAGGNGLGDGNKGADVGWLNFRSTGSEESYGSGKASANVYGGTINEVFGGSNTLGYIRTSTSVNVKEYTGSDHEICDLNVKKVYGAGNNAPIECPIDICLDCSEGADMIYAGANNADAQDINLVIASGTYGQVFGGNNDGGAVKGKITVTIDEKGCTPVIIKELYACGNKADYSVYGYEVDTDGKTIRTNLYTCDDCGHESDTEFTTCSECSGTSVTHTRPVKLKTTGDRLYDDPVINVISCTAIGSIFGGGYKAAVYGDPHVNVNMTTGDFSTSEKTKVAAWVYSTDGAGSTISTRQFKTELDFYNGLLASESLGTIGNIYGGGNLAPIYGNTFVNICNDKTTAHLSRLTTDTTPVESRAFITPRLFGIAYGTEEDAPTGSIYGGGKMANVHGNTRVHIRNGNIEGNVFGAGQGDAAQPDAALVKGKTEVIIGEK